MEKKAQMNLLKTFAVTLVVTAIVIAMGAKVFDQVDDVFPDHNLTANGTPDIGYLVLHNGTKALMDLAIWLPIVAIVVAAIVIIGLLSFLGKGGR